MLTGEMGPHALHVAILYIDNF